MSINTSYQLHLKIITPIHVGGQQEKNLQRGIDYLQVDKRFYLVNKATVFNPESSIHPDELADALARGDEHHLARLFQKDKARYLIPLNGTPGSTGEIKAFIKDGAYGKAYIPGSSIKGAMRSAVAHYFCNGFARKNPDQTFIKKFDESLFRLIKVCDNPVGETRLYRSKVISLVNVGGRNLVNWKETRNRNVRSFKTEGFDTSFESPMTGTVLNGFNLLMASHLLKIFPGRINLSAEAEELLSTPDPINGLFMAINFATSNHLKRELSFFKKYKDGDKVSLIIKGIENLLNLIDRSDKPTNALLRFGSGSGFHSISGDWQYEDHIAENWENPNWGDPRQDMDYKKYGINPRLSQGKLKFKSRRIVFNDNASEFYLMGYILLSREAFKDQEPRSLSETENKLVIEKEVVESKPVEAYKPVMHAADALKNQAVVDAKVVGQQGIQMLVSPFIQGYEQKSFSVRYPGGLDEGTIIRVKVNFIRKSIKDGYNLSFFGIAKS
jgi:CRISPR/Cas system CSM-associated protein Csm5 (group 7 of RAMP superfamily)